MIGNEEFLAQFNAKVAAGRTPLSGGIDLTERCNLACEHCYLGPGTDASSEASTDQVLSIIDQVADAGCLFFLFTGGEPLLRSDFGQLYRRAKERGMFVTVFTNAALVSRELCELFSELPPRSVEVTICGATADVHESITAVPGSFAQTVTGVKMLIDAGVKVELKTVVMKKNAAEFGEMEQLAASLGVSFRMDAMVFPKLNGDSVPLAFHISPESAVDMELADSVRAEEWQNYAARVEGLGVSDKLYDCGTGVNCFHVSSSGVLHPCLMAREFGYDLTRGTFAEGWNEEMPKIRQVPVDPSSPCLDCGERAVCSFCPASFALGDDGEEYRDYVCEVAGGRQRRLMNHV